MAFKARLLPGLSDIVFDDDPQARVGLQPGDYELETMADGQRYFWLRCPGPCGQIEPLTLRPALKALGQASWEFSGTPQAPTLSPSIHHPGCWHGWLQNGIYRSCEEAVTEEALAALSARFTFPSAS